MPSRKILLRLTVFALIAFALIAVAPPARASAWNYGCKGALPVFNESEAIFFNRDLLALLPKGWLKGPLRDFALRDPVDDVVVLAKTTNENSGLAPTMVFTLLDHPDQKLTLTEKSSKTISDVHDAALGPRSAQTTTYKKVYHYVSDFGYLGPFDVKMDCLNYELSAPLR
jgi:hypothetical protein